jgi:uncharacterized protein (TIRG00374 family)
LLRRVGPAIGGLVILAVAFGVVLPGIADYDDVVEASDDLSGKGAAMLGLVVVLNVVTYAPPWMAALPGLGFRRALIASQASSAAAGTLPGGEALAVAVSMGMLRAWGFRGSTVALAALVVSVWNQLTKITLPVLALALLTLSGSRDELLTLAAFVGVAVLAVAATLVVLALHSDAQARRFGEATGRWLSRLRQLARKPPVRDFGDRMVRFRREAISLLRRRWFALTVTSAVGQLTMFAVLFVSLRALDVSAEEVSLAEAFASWSLIRLLTAIPITPGGIGLVEVGLSGALVAFGGDNAEVVAAVLFYRLLTWLPTLVLGAFCLLTWRRLVPPAVPAAETPTS